jgi:hypothetical protein
MNPSLSEQIRMEILDTCRDGSSILFRLESELTQVTEKSDETLIFLELIEDLNKRIVTFKEYVPIIVMLLDKCFKSEY